MTSYLRRRRGADDEPPDFAEDDPRIDEALKESENSFERVRLGLRAIVEPRQGLERRVLSQAKSTLLDRETVMTLASLFNLGWRTPKVVLLDRPETETDDGAA
jgi:hypothetical protein